MGHCQPDVNVLQACNWPNDTKTGGNERRKWVNQRLGNVQDDEQLLTILTILVTIPNKLLIGIGWSSRALKTDNHDLIDLALHLSTMDATTIAKQFSGYYYGIFDTDRSQLSTLYVCITYQTLFNLTHIVLLEGDLDDDMGRGRISRHSKNRQQADGIYSCSSV